MDDIDRELISLLCTKAGMLMEDHSTLALTISGLENEDQKAAINELAHSSRQIAALSVAAQSIAQ